MSPLMLVLLVMFMPPDEPICLFFILDAKSLSATTIDMGWWGGGGVGGGGVGYRRGQRRERTGQRRGCERRDDGGEKEGRTGDEKAWGRKGEKDRVQVQEFMTYSIAEFSVDGIYVVKRLFMQ